MRKMAAMETKTKKRNFTDTETEVLVSEVDQRKVILFGSHSSGITNKKKCVEWQHVTAAVNAVGSTNRTVPEIKKKWSDLKVGAKKRLACHRQSVSATGGGQGAPKLSPLETRMASIIGETSVCGIVSEREGDTDMVVTGEPGKSLYSISALLNKIQIIQIDVVVLPEDGGMQGVVEIPGAESTVTVQCPEVPSTSAQRPHGTGGRVLTEAVLQTQKDTIDAITIISDELKEIRAVLCDIASTLKDIVKK